LWLLLVYGIVDFYCFELKLVIEIDGDSHNSENAQAYDLERTQILESYGLKIQHFALITGSR